MLNKLSQHFITAQRTLFRKKICLDIMCFALTGLLDAGFEAAAGESSKGSKPWQSGHKQSFVTGSWPYFLFLSVCSWKLAYNTVSKLSSSISNTSSKTGDNPRA